MDELLDAQDVATMLKINVKTVGQYAASGKIPGAKVGGAWLFFQADIIDWLRSQFKCPSTNRQTPKTGISRSRTTDGEFDKLLGLPTGKRRRNTTTNIKPISGARKNQVSDMSRLEMLVRLGSRYAQEGGLTDMHYATFCQLSGPEQICVRLMAQLSRDCCPTKLLQRGADISTWYQQSVEIQDITRILSGLLSKRGESDG